MKREHRRLYGGPSTIPNNVEPVNGRARPTLDNATQELLSRADAPVRARIMEQADQDELGAKFDLTVGGKKRLLNK